MATIGIRERVVTGGWTRLAIVLAAAVAAATILQIINLRQLPFVALVCVLGYVLGTSSSGGTRERGGEIDQIAQPQVERVAEVEAPEGSVEHLAPHADQTALFALTDAITSSAGVREIVSNSVLGIGKLFRVSAAEIVIKGQPHENYSVFRCGSVVVASNRGEDSPRLNRPLSTRAMETGRLTIAQSGAGRGQEIDIAAAASGISHFAVIPLRSNDRILGAMTLAGGGDSLTVKAGAEVLNSIGSIVGGAIENRQVMMELKRLSVTDSVTGLVNHRYMEKQLASEIGRAGRYGHRLTVIMVDVDDFKRINDRFGHPVGDLALRRISSALTSACRGTDHVGRFGGDEFLVLLPETDVDHALVVCDRILRHVGGLKILPGGPGSEQIRVSVTLGMSVFPDAGENGRDLIMAADRNLYGAKRYAGDRSRESRMH